MNPFFAITICHNDPISSLYCCGYKNNNTQKNNGAGQSSYRKWERMWKNYVYFYNNEMRAILQATCWCSGCHCCLQALGPILSSNLCLCRVLYVLSVSSVVSWGFRGFFVCVFVLVFFLLFFCFVNGGLVFFCLQDLREMPSLPRTKELHLPTWTSEIQTCTTEDNGKFHSIRMKQKA